MDRLRRAEGIRDVLFEIVLRDRVREIGDDDSELAAFVENRLLLLGWLCRYRAAHELGLV